MKTRIFYEGNEDQFRSLLVEKQYSNIILLADANTNGFCIATLKNLIPELIAVDFIVIPQGEQSKNIDVCLFVWDRLDQLKANRSTLIINIGGGMVSDLGGFAASVYKRGLDFIHIPTTLLAMVDACYGGKTGIDFNGIKNNLGTFQHPVAIYINTVFLRTLSERILISGIAETIKHALISSSIWWNDMLTYKHEDFISIAVIKRSLETKTAIVKQDENDNNVRQVLNFGHTVGHAIESCSLQTSIPLLHGEAVMLGMFFELKLSIKKFNLPETILEQYVKIRNCFFPSLEMSFTFDNLLPYIIQDKKNNLDFRMSLLKKVGGCETQVIVSKQDIQELFA